MINIAKKTLFNKNIPSCYLDSILLMAKCLNFSKEEVLFNLQKEVSNIKKEKFLKLVDKRANYVPISHLLGKRDFYESSFIVNKNVLDPRADSEILIEAAKKHLINKNQDLKILELGVGSACLIISILKIFPYAYGEAVDISKRALSIALKNSQLHRITERIKFYQSNWFSSVTRESFDLIISNPPYIKTKEIQTLSPEVKNHDPYRALNGGSDGLMHYKKIAKSAFNFLKKNGILILEIGYTQRDSVIKIFSEKKLFLKECHKDLENRDRCLVFSKRF